MSAKSPPLKLLADPTDTSVTLVVNSGPLISLARIGRLDLLPEIFGQIVVPRAVFEEVTKDPALPGAQAIAEAGWLRVVQVSHYGSIERISSSLGAGEREVLALAQELGATAAIDERRGRKVAEELGIPQTGTVAILLVAKRGGLIPAVTPLLDELRSKGVRLSPRLYEDARRLAGEE